MLTQKITTKTLIHFLLTLTFTVNAYSQSGEVRELLRNAESLAAKEDYSGAISRYGEVLKLEGYNVHAYKRRGQCYLMLENYKDALFDFRQAVAFKPDDMEIHALIATVYAKQGNLKEALIEIRKVPENMITIDIKYYLFYFRIMDGEHEKVHEEILQMIANTKYSENPVLLFLGGLAREATGNSDGAFNRFYWPAARKVKPFEVYESNYRKHLALFPVRNYIYKCGINLYNRGLFKEAYGFFEQGLSLNPRDGEFLRLAGNCCYENDEFIKAEQLFFRLINEKHYFPDVYYKLCEIQRNGNRLTDALLNCLEATKLDSGRCEYFYSAGWIQEEQGDFKKAREYYYKALHLSKADSTCSGLSDLDDRYARVCRIIWHENKETDPPLIKITKPQLTRDKIILIPPGQKQLEVQYSITDQSTISKLMINGITQEIDTGIYNPTFSYTITSKSDTFEISATDTYGNSSTALYVIEQPLPPRIILESPSSLGDQIIPERSDDRILRILGTVKTQTDLQSIRINGMDVEFDKYELQPSFEVELELTGKSDSVVLEAEDHAGNIEINRYYINRERAKQVESNPVGRTWVYFISNWDYEDHTRLTGPEIDLRKIKEALNNYQIDSIVVKRNFEKRDFEKFFIEDLPNDVKRFKINSLLIWYAGHGKKIDENSVYWIPVKAKKGQQIDYYNLSYMKYEVGKLNVTHLLVVSDACQTGSTLSRRMRDDQVEKNCDREEYDSQSRFVLTSSNSENSDDNSKFAEYFSQILKTNSRACLPVNQIVVALKSSLKKHGQFPVFEEIDVTTMNKGTFFFFRKENKR